MARFRVTFRKIVYGNTGQVRDICQRVVEVDARDAGSAEAAAIDCFCDLEHITHWLNHADRLEIARIAPTSGRRSESFEEAKDAA